MKKYFRLQAAFTALVFLLLAGAVVAQTQGPMRPQALAIDSGTKTATATAGAATLNKNSGVITSEALVTAAAANYTLTLTDSQITASDIVVASVAMGTATTGNPVVTRITPANGSVVFIVRNVDAAAALNGTIKVSFAALRGN